MGGQSSRPDRHTAWSDPSPAVPLGIALVAIGVLLLLDRADVIDVPLGALIFPMVLVVAGVALLRGGLALRAASARLGGIPGDRADFAGVGATALFGDARLTVPDEDRGPDLVAVAATPVFGDVEIEVPAGWRVLDRTTSILGDVHLPEKRPDDPRAPGIELHGLVLFGDLRVRHLDARETTQ